MAREGSEKKSHFGRRFLGFLFVLLLLAALVMYVIPLTETDKGETVDGASSWMGELPDGIRLNELAIPGTHDSATQFVTLAFFGKCQSKSIPRQLDCGFRYLDIRLAVEEQQLKLVHGFVNCKTGFLPWADTLYLDQLLNQCFDFLDRHPTETILFVVKQDHGKESTAEFQRMLDKYTQQNPERWLLTDTIPTLGQARGKLVLFRRYDDAAALGQRAGIPLIWADQGGSKDTSPNTELEDNGSYLLYVQDRYCYPVEDKWAAFIQGLGAGDPGGGDVSLSFLSSKGTWIYGHPFYFADALNPRLLGRELKKTDGWILVDFATAPMAKHIYEVNFD